MIKLPPKLENELIVAGMFEQTKFLTLTIDDKSTPGKIHFSDVEFFLYAINTKTGECLLFSDNGEWVREFISGVHKGNQTRPLIKLVPLIQQNQELIISLFSVLKKQTSTVTGKNKGFDKTIDVVKK